uniref:Uncharacterized protein n=1 Tax=Gracilinema caldarium TaxID=215591 RepID=A0A7C3E2U9_9SPIR
MVIRIINLLFFIGLCFSLITCSLKKEDTKEMDTNKLQQSNESVSLDVANHEDSRLTKLSSSTFKEILEQDWGFTIDIIPIALSEETYLGGIVRKNGIWVAGYDSGFATCELVSMEMLRSDIVRFVVDIWKNEDPERPFAKRKPNTPSYRFYVDLSESDFKAAVRKGVLEKKQVVVIPVEAYNIAGERVGEWFRNISTGNDKKESQ